jgi:hypothetical protein
VRKERKTEELEEENRIVTWRAITVMLTSLLQLFPAPRSRRCEVYYGATLNVGRLPMIPCKLDLKMCKREALEVEQRWLLLGGWDNKPLSCSVVLAGSSP